MRRRHDERGSVGVLLVTGMCLALLTVAMGGSVLINWFALARHAEQSAELAALGAASAAVAQAPACPAAREVATRNGSRVVSCEVRGAGRHVVVEIGVEVALEPRFPGGPETVRRHATAGTA